MSITNKQIGTIKLAKARTGMTDDEYSAMLAGYGVDSCKKLTQRQFDDVLRRFEKLGFSIRRSTSKKSKKRPMSVPEKKGLYIRKIDVLLNQMGKTWAYADGISQRMFGVDKAEWLNIRQLAGSVIPALKIHQKREAARRRA